MGEGTDFDRWSKLKVAKGFIVKNVSWKFYGNLMFSFS